MQSTIYLPHPINYGILNLFATRDHLEDSDTNAEFQQCHAFDLFMILGLMTEEDWNSKSDLIDALESTKQMDAARTIIENYFSTGSDRGTFALKEFVDEYRPDIPEDYIDDFLDDLKEIYEI